VVRSASSASAIAVDQARQLVVEREMLSDDVGDVGQHREAADFGSQCIPLVGRQFAGQVRQSQLDRAAVLGHRFAAPGGADSYFVTAAAERQAERPPERAGKIEQ
jgi:hypothetical protein